MNILEFFKNLLTDFDEKGNDYLNFKNAKKCMIKFKLSESKMIVFGFRYIWGLTSYRGFFRDVLQKNMDIFDNLMNKIKNQAKKDYYYDEIFIRFYSNNNLYIDIPLNVFSQQYNLSKEELVKKLWHKRNLERLINYSNIFKKEVQENYERI
jgi:hypothetical protein